MGDEVSQLSLRVVADGEAGSGVWVFLLPVVLAVFAGWLARRGFTGKFLMIFACSVLVVAQVLWGAGLSAGRLMAGAIFVVGAIGVFVGMRLGGVGAWGRLAAFAAGWIFLFWLFVKKLDNAEPLFLLAAMGLAAAAQSLLGVGFFWIVVGSFTFCQPYCWECVLGGSFLLVAVSGARGRMKSLTTLLFLGGGLATVFAILFPIAALLLGQNFHSLEALMRDGRVRDALFLTGTSAAVSTAVLLVTMTPLAYAISRLRFPGRGALLAVVDLPIIIPQSAAGIALLCVFGQRQFVGGLLAEKFGMVFDGTVLGICLAQIFVAMPFMLKSAVAAFDAVDIEQEGVAETLGASAWRVFWRVALPGAARGVALGAVMAFARAAGEFGALLFLAPTPETAPVAVFNRFNSMGLAEATPLVSLLLILSLLTFFLLQMVTRLLPRNSSIDRGRQ